ncbi:carboxypeptidase-like regulatory domain-containing protein [uncultured Polaribacter sp.]|uniref:carboxypeptidase-like regulatory domain-containing protein n=1 Tax=uncultured Polaribacter sp. TaxID=174711 RepID=UPI002638DD86|nr:carboxypeptidase-like regulatory domain-containing protein [uncultured Polaribacter sp.]
MKTTKTATLQKPIILLWSLFLSLFLFSNTSLAQEILVKGVVKGLVESGTELLDGANVYFKNANEATTTNKKGEFTFPKKLKKGDILVFSYLGFEKQNIKIKEDTSFLTIILKEEDIEMLGALNSEKRFKSKRAKQ